MWIETYMYFPNVPWGRCEVHGWSAHAARAASAYTALGWDMICSQKMLCCESLHPDFTHLWGHCHCWNIHSECYHYSSMFHFLRPLSFLQGLTLDIFTTEWQIFTKCQPNSVRTFPIGPCIVYLYISMGVNDQGQIPVHCTCMYIVYWGN